MSVERGGGGAQENWKAPEDKGDKKKDDVISRRTLLKGLLATGVSTVAFPQTGRRVNQRETQQGPAPQEPPPRRRKESQSEPQPSKVEVNQEVQSAPVSVEVGGVSDTNGIIRAEVQDFVGYAAKAMGKSIVAGIEPFRLQFNDIDFKDDKAGVKEAVANEGVNQAGRVVDNAPIYTGVGAIDRGIAGVWDRVVRPKVKKGTEEGTYKAIGHVTGKLTLKYTAEFGPNSAQNVPRTAIISYKKLSLQNQSPRYEIDKIKDSEQEFTIEPQVLEGDIKSGAAIAFVIGSSNESKKNLDGGYGLTRILGAYAKYATGMAVPGVTTIPMQRRRN